MLLLVLVLVLVATQLPVCRGMHESLNFELLPGTRSCFYEDFAADTPVKIIDVFVQAGGSLDVLLTVHGPLSLEQVRKEDFEVAMFAEKINGLSEIESDTSSYITEFKPEDDFGTYGICLDNRNAHFLTKTVQLDVRDAKRSDPVVLHMGGEPKVPPPPGSELYQEDSVIRLRESMERIRKQIKRVQVQQQTDRHRLQLHSASNVLTNNKVVTGSVVETLFFIAAACFQIFFVRHWFASRTHTKAAVSV